MPKTKKKETLDEIVTKEVAETLPKAEPVKVVDPVPTLSTHEQLMLKKQLLLANGILESLAWSKPREKAQQIIVSVIDKL